MTDIETGTTASLLDLLNLRRVDHDAFETIAVAEERRWLYGGQVAAQALVAAGRTVEPGRAPHSLHGYFLRKGDVGVPVRLRVLRDRDGKQYSARRVEVTQEGALLFTMSASFQRPGGGQTLQVAQPPAGPDPESLEPPGRTLLVSVDYRIPPHADAGKYIPSKYWARCALPLPDDPLLHAAVLTYISDWSTGLISVHDGDWVPSPSLDHAVWFHRQMDLSDWVLFDLRPQRVHGGRGFYSGAVYDKFGNHGASLTQEALYGRTMETE